MRGEGKKMNELVDKALSAGFTKAAWLNALKLECEARIREYCNPEGCAKHGKNWVCPPSCGSLQECAGKIRRFDCGILLQSVSELQPPVAAEKYRALNLEHNLRLREFVETECAGRGGVLVLTSGGCVFCDACAYPEPCVKPDIRMNSLSAYGIDVGKLCERAGLEYSFRPDRVYYVALVLSGKRA